MTSSVSVQIYTLIKLCLLCFLLTVNQQNRISSMVSFNNGHFPPHTLTVTSKPRDESSDDSSGSNTGTYATSEPRDESSHGGRGSNTGTYATSEPRDESSDDGSGSNTGTYATSELRDESSDDGGGSTVTIPVVIAVIYIYTGCCAQTICDEQCIQLC